MELNFLEIINTEKRTDFLFPKRSFWTGFSSVLSILGNQNKINTSKSGQEANYKALKSDWEMIGQDIQNAMNAMNLAQSSLAEDWNDESDEHWESFL